MKKDNTINISEEKALELLRKRLLHLRETTDFFNAVFRTIGGYAIIAADRDGTIQAYNEEVIKLYGYAHKEIVGNKMNIGVFYPTDFVETGKLSGTIKDTMIHGTCSFESEQTRKDGHYYWCERLIAPISNEEGQITHSLFVQEDITEKMELKDNLSLFTSYASFDGLAGLYNRTRFMELLEEWILQAGAHHYTGAILLIDIEVPTYGERPIFEITETAAVHDLGRAVKFLRELGVDYAQGYFIGKPAPETLIDDSMLL